MKPKTKFFVTLALIYLNFIIWAAYFFMPDIVATDLMAFKLWIGAGALLVVLMYVADYVYNKINPS